MAGYLLIFHAMRASELNCFLAWAMINQRFNTSETGRCRWVFR